MRRYKQRTGALVLDGVAVHFELEQASERLDYGIDGGRLVNLELKIKGARVALYELGWSLKPTCEAAEIALEVLCFEYNRGD
jgi:hypothetical protein